VHHAIERGINFLNWPGEADSPGGADAVSTAVASLGSQRESIVVCVQFGSRTATDAAEPRRPRKIVLVAGRLFGLPSPCPSFPLGLTDAKPVG
jgi:hypothetical protein